MCCAGARPARLRSSTRTRGTRDKQSAEGRCREICRPPLGGPLARRLPGSPGGPNPAKPFRPANKVAIMVGEEGRGGLRFGTVTVRYGVVRYGVVRYRTVRYKDELGRNPRSHG